MITVTYLGSAVMARVLAVLFAGGALKSPWQLEALIFGAFFLASAGASAAYLTVSEIFPLEMRALAIAFFYAVGTAVGGISGPLLFGQLIATGSRGAVALAFVIGAVVWPPAGSPRSLPARRLKESRLKKSRRRSARKSTTVQSARTQARMM